MANSSKTKLRKVTLTAIQDGCKSLRVPGQLQTTIRQYNQKGNDNETNRRNNYESIHEAVQ